MDRLDLDPVGVFAPWAGPEERELRIRIHRARDQATARASRSLHGQARVVYWLAADIASEKVFARLAKEELQDAIEGLTRAFHFAGWIEQHEPPDER